MTNIVKLHEEKPTRVWVCDCGCSTFSLIEGGTAECAHCGGILDSGDEDVSGWMDLPDREAKVEDPIVDIQGNGSVDFARARVQKLCQDPSVRLLISGNDDGTVVFWSAAASKDQAEWSIELIDAAKSLALKNLKELLESED